MEASVRLYQSVSFKDLFRWRFPFRLLHEQTASADAVLMIHIDKTTRKMN